MIRQQIGDLLEIEYQGKFYYVVVLTKVVMFGGNIVFAHHTDGRRQDRDDIVANRKGFNVCTDLLLPKKEGVVRRLHRYRDVSEFWLTKYAKNCHEHRPGHTAKEWFIYDIDDPRTVIARVTEMPREYREAMDDATSSFDLVAEMILRRYTPDQNPFLEPPAGWVTRLSKAPASAIMLVIGIAMVPVALRVNPAMVGVAAVCLIVGAAGLFQSRRPDGE